jgi:hypothetical protein
MNSDAQVPANSKAMTITGWILGGLPAALMIGTSPMAILKLPAAVEGMKQYGYPASAMTAIGLAELVSAVLYVIPKTSILGAIPLTGYLGGATATHVRAGEMSFFMPILMGVFYWGGLWFRNPDIRALIPIRRK